MEEAIKDRLHINRIFMPQRLGNGKIELFMPRNWADDDFRRVATSRRNIAMA